MNNAYLISIGAYKGKFPACHLTVSSFLPQEDSSLSFFQIPILKDNRGNSFQQSSNKTKREKKIKSFDCVLV